MTQFYEDNAQRLELLKQLDKRITKKTWADGYLANTEVMWDYANSEPKYEHTFCFVGHISRVLTPHFTDAQAAGTDIDERRRLEYPTSYDGGKDLMHRLAIVAWEFYGKAIARGLGITARTLAESYDQDTNDQDVLVFVNDNSMRSSDGIYAGFHRIRRIVRETKKRLEEGTL